MLLYTKFQLSFKVKGRASKQERKVFWTAAQRPPPGASLYKQAHTAAIPLKRLLYSILNIQLSFTTTLHIFPNIVSVTAHDW